MEMVDSMDELTSEMLDAKIATALNKITQHEEYGSDWLVSLRMTILRVRLETAGEEKILYKLTLG